MRFEIKGLVFMFFLIRGLGCGSWVFLGGGSTRFRFLVLAGKNLINFFFQKLNHDYCGVLHYGSRSLKFINHSKF